MENLANTRGKLVIGSIKLGTRNACPATLLLKPLPARHLVSFFLRPQFFYIRTNVKYFAYVFLAVIGAKLFSKKMDTMYVWPFFRPFIHIQDRVNFHEDHRFVERKNTPVSSLFLFLCVFYKTKFKYL